MKPEQIRKEYLDEIDKALVRIGSISSEAINWLIRFAQLDVPSLSVGDFQNLQFELAAFSMFGNYLGKSYVVSEGDFSATYSAGTRTERPMRTTGIRR